MGGHGSTKWRGQGTKPTVESALDLTSRAFKPFMDLDPGHSGIMTWISGQEKSVVATMSFRRVALEDPDARVFRFLYIVGKGENAREANYTVRMIKTVPHYGGTRWYFHCPLVVNGKECPHRVSKLFLPSGGLYFGCRTCLGLTYTSSQESHKFDGMLKTLAANMGRDINPQMVKRLLKRTETKLLEEKRKNDAGRQRLIRPIR